MKAVRERLLRLGLTQQEAAKRLSVSRSTIARVEAGRKVGGRVVRRIESAIEALEGGSRPASDAAEALHDLVANATGGAPSPLVMELIAQMKDKSQDEQASILQAFAIGMKMMAEPRPREKAE